MFQNDNSAIIKKLTKRSLKSDKKRNFFIIVAIMLTTLLLGTVFSIGSSLLKSVETENLRLLGTTCHGAISYPTAAQIEKLNTLDYVKMVGLDATLGFAKLPHISLQLTYHDHNSWEYMRKPTKDDITGNYPQAEDEIMVPLDILEKMGIKPEIGIKIPLAYSTDINAPNNLTTQEFKLTGWYTDYGSVKARGEVAVANISQSLFQKHGKTVEKTGAANFIFDDDSQILESAERLKTDLQPSENQFIVTTKEFEINSENALTAGLSILAIIAFLVLTGYLLIYNVLHISVSHDVRFYGLLKTLGTTPKQIKRIVGGQILFLTAVGIPLGIIGALVLSVIAVPTVLTGLNIVSTGPVVSFSPFIYLGAAGFALGTAVLGAMKPARMAAEISPIEAQKFTGLGNGGNRKYKPAHGKPYRMAVRNVFRDKKRAVIVLCSLFLGISTFVTVTTLVSAMDMGQYIDTLYLSDFLLQNNTLDDNGLIIDNGVSHLNSDVPPQELFDNDLLTQLEELPGIEHLSVSTHGWVNSNDEGLLRFIGVDAEAIDKAAAAFDSSIDLEAFKRGDFALVSMGDSDLTISSAELFSKVSSVTVMPVLYENLEQRPEVTVPLGGCAPAILADTVNVSYPTFIASDILMDNIFGEMYLNEVRLDVLPEYERQTLDMLKAITKNIEIIPTEQSKTRHKQRLSALNLI